jgi:hypothetical protein
MRAFYSCLGCKERPRAHGLLVAANPAAELSELTKLWLKSPRTLEVRDGPPLLAELQLLGDGLITPGVGRVQILKQTPTLADHDQQSPPRAVVLCVVLQMLSEAIDFFGQKRNLNIRGPGVLIVDPEALNNLLLVF